MTARNSLFLIVALGALTASALLFGGSAIYYLGGADALDINGRTAPHGGPAMLPEDGWRFYGGDPGGHRYSTAALITPANVAALEEAWHYRSGDLGRRTPEQLRRSAGETTPILIDNSLVFCTPFNEVIALDPGSGQEKWRYDPEIDLDQRPANQFICRGVAYWRDPLASADAVCARRIVSATNDGSVIALDSQTGQVCTEFGDEGTVRIDPGMALEWPGEFQITSPPVVIGNVVVVGSAISDNLRVVAPTGAVRAYDVRSGELRWTFDPIPRREAAPQASDWQGSQPPAEGHANAWAPMSADPDRGLVFVPTSSPSPDFYGGLRPGDNRYANSVVALRGDTGEVVWSRQLVHHDIWDFDLPSQPGLYTIWHEGRQRDVVAQSTKMGLVFVLDRDTGEPVIPIEERPVPQGAVAGEVLSKTQPFPVRPPPVVPDVVDPDDAFGLTWLDRRACSEKISALRQDGLYTPPSEQGTLFRPFTGGGANWGGSAFDPTRNLLVVNMNNLGHLIQLIPADQVEAVSELLHSSEIAPQRGAPYGVRRELILSPLGLPCTPPPWGVLAAIDLAEGSIVWRRTLGTTEDLAYGLALELGTPTLGGPVITGSGLIFIASTLDYYLRALSVESGAELWRGRLPTAAIATPMTYAYEGRQYVVVNAGGYGNVDTPPGDSLVAFALPAAPNGSKKALQ